MNTKECLDGTRKRTDMKASEALRKNENNPFKELTNEARVKYEITYKSSLTYDFSYLVLPLAEIAQRLEDIGE